MANRDERLESLRALVKKSPVSETEILCFGQEEATTRFANNQIHQNVAVEDVTVACRVVNGGKTGHARCNQLTGEGSETMVRRAVERLNLMPAQPAEISLIDPQTYSPLDNYDEETATMSAAQRASLVGHILEQVERYGLMAAGTIVSGSHDVAIVNSRGLEAYHRSSHFQMTLTVYDSTGASAWTAREGFRYIDGSLSRPVTKTIERTIHGKNPQTVKPGKYTVILEPPAVGTFLEFLGWLAFGAKEYLYGRSCLTGRLGQKVTGEAVSIRDNAFHARTLGIPFDFEGTAKRDVMLIDKGVAQTVVHDSQTAREMGTQSTGHSLPHPNSAGPMTLNLVMEAGMSSIDDLISGTERGILVTRFHYNRTVDPKKTLLTGMTRDGTFIIKDGKVDYPIRNLRYNESVLGSFDRIEGVANHQSLVGEYGKVVVPALKIRDFLFTDIVQS